MGELLSNYIGHAYSDGGDSVYMNLSVDESDEITLEVSDNEAGTTVEIKLKRNEDKKRFQFLKESGAM